MIIREIRVDDAAEFIALIKEVEAKSSFMLMEPGERITTPEQQAKQLERIEKQSNATILAAEEHGKLIGYLLAMGGTVKKTKHSAYLAIGILEDFRGKGIGSALFEHIEDWALKNKISRLELTTVIENQAGVALYKKSGFDIEGVKRNSLMINGKLYDEYFMSKLL